MRRNQSLDLHLNKCSLGFLGEGLVGGSWGSLGCRALECLASWSFSLLTVLYGSSLCPSVWTRGNTLLALPFDALGSTSVCFLSSWSGGFASDPCPYLGLHPASTACTKKPFVCPTPSWGEAFGTQSASLSGEDVGEFQGASGSEISILEGQKHSSPGRVEPCYQLLTPGSLNLSATIFDLERPCNP